MKDCKDQSHIYSVWRIKNCFSQRQQSYIFHSKFWKFIVNFFVTRKMLSSNERSSANGYIYNFHSESFSHALKTRWQITMVLIFHIFDIIRTTVLLDHIFIRCFAVRVSIVKHGGFFYFASKVFSKLFSAFVCAYWCTFLKTWNNIKHTCILHLIFNYHLFFKYFLVYSLVIRLSAQYSTSHIWEAIFSLLYIISVYLKNNV